MNKFIPNCLSKGVLAVIPIASIIINHGSHGKEVIHTGRGLSTRENIRPEDYKGITRDTYNTSNVKCKDLKYHTSSETESMSSRLIWKHKTGSDHKRKLISISDLIRGGYSEKPVNKDAPVAYIDREGRVIERLELSARVRSVLGEDLVKKIGPQCTMYSTPLSDNFSWHQTLHQTSNSTQIPSLTRVTIHKDIGYYGTAEMAYTTITIYLQDNSVASPINTYRKVYSMSKIVTNCNYYRLREIFNSYSKQQVLDYADREWDNQKIKEPEQTTWSSSFSCK